MSTDVIKVRAEMRLLPTSAGGRISPVRGSYRPNHNFFDPDASEMTIGFIELPDGNELRPGDTIEVPIDLWWWPKLRGEVHPGREWRIQEGARLVGFGRVLEVLDQPR